MKPGLFIVLEGIDGSGTTSQCRALSKALESRGRSVLLTCEPSKGDIGRLIRQRLAADGPKLDPRALAFMFAADRIDHVRTEIQPALAEGVDVVCDRYVLSSLAYQSLDCGPEWVHTINVGAPWPHYTFFLSVPVDVAQLRVAERARKVGTAAEIFDAHQLQVRVAHRYDELVTRYDAPRYGSVRRVDGARPPEEVTKAILDFLDRDPI